MKADYDLYGLACVDAGEESHRSGKAVMFRTCPICGHHDCFAYYPKNNTWFCFSTNHSGIQGGSAIDYVMAKHNVTFHEAVRLLRGEI